MLSRRVEGGIRPAICRLRQKIPILRRPSIEHYCADTQIDNLMSLVLWQDVSKSLQRTHDKMKRCFAYYKSCVIVHDLHLDLDNSRSRREVSGIYTLQCQPSSMSVNSSTLRQPSQGCAFKNASPRAFDTNDIHDAVCNELGCWSSHRRMYQPLLRAVHS